LCEMASLILVCTDDVLFQLHPDTFDFVC
jgi:hypothetical protein